MEVGTCLHQGHVPSVWMYMYTLILCVVSGCLALAELGRRGLLLPERLEDGKRRKKDRLCVT